MTEIGSQREKERTGCSGQTQYVESEGQRERESKKEGPETKQIPKKS
jgi:hypothetical protein